LLDIIIKLADILSNIYEKTKQIHNDLKPANIIVNPKKEVLLIDFGTSSSENQDQYYGTETFKSPERNTTQLSDIYSFGITIDMLFGGRTIFLDKSIRALVRGMIKVDPSTRQPQTMADIHNELIRIKTKLFGQTDALLEQKPDALGGIDFNPNNIKIKTTGRKINFDVPIDEGMVEVIRVNGLTPVIFTITPINNLPLLFGKEQEKTEESIALQTSL